LDANPEVTGAAESPRVSIAGATGFVGQELAKELANDFRVVALGRRATTDPKGGDSGPGLSWQRCDLFSLRETEAALSGARVAVYLVHSMSPNARLTQGNFEDLDLLLADNFGRAAARAGVERIIYLGGLVPRDPQVELSPHLSSRLEVEKALGLHGVPVTSVRAGLVVGPEGSSLNILVRLVERLPLMICPSWTSSKTQPIALSDVIDLLAWCCRHAETRGRVCEVGGPDVFTYREMMQATARVLGRRRAMIPVPFVTPALSELWVSLVTGSPRALVAPLIESLQHPMLAEDRWLQEQLGSEGIPFDQALRSSVEASRVWKRPIVRSVQRFPRPKEHSARSVGLRYPEWLSTWSSWFLGIEWEESTFRIRLLGTKTPLLVLREDTQRSAEDRVVFKVDGGLLAYPTPRANPRLEFRLTPDGDHVLAALQDFEPRLPWWIYKVTQAPIHAFIMRAFGWSLRD
jgi:uncharacterized protein YbjT (DUF2867 family)